MSVEERKFQTRIGTVVLVLVCFEELILILSETHTHRALCIPLPQLDFILFTGH